MKRSASLGGDISAFVLVQSLFEIQFGLTQSLFGVEPAPIDRSF